MALFEWHVTPEYINEHWTEEVLYLMFKSRNKRLRPATAPAAPQPMHNYMSSEDFLNKWSGSFVVQKVN